LQLRLTFLKAAASLAKLTVTHSRSLWSAQ